MVNSITAAPISRSVKNIIYDMKNGINIRDSSIIPKKVSSIAVRERNMHRQIKRKINAKPTIMVG
jgi:hypothetical protein